MSVRNRWFKLEDAISEIGDDWERAVREKSGDPTAFPWWIKSVAQARNQLEQLKIYVEWEKKKLKTVIPFLSSVEHWYGVPIRVLEPAGNLVSYHQNLLIDGDEVETLGRVLSQASLSKWDVLRIKNVVDNGRTYEILTHLAKAKGRILRFLRGDSSPYLPISSDWESFLLKRSASFRYRLGRKARNIGKTGAEMRWFKDASETSEFLAHMLTIESASRKVAAGMAVSHRPMEQRYYELLLPELADRGMLRANVLFLGERPIAYSLCYEFEKRWGQLKTSFDDQYAEISPGTYVVDAAIQQAFTEGAIEFDFLGDVMPHKLEWTKQMRVHWTIEMYGHTVIGNLMGYLKKYCIDTLRRHLRVGSTNASTVVQSLPQRG